jgi:hypothetical protein
MTVWYEAIEHAASEDHGRRESLARPARVRLLISSMGTGETQITGKSALMFGAIMMEEPSFSFGVIANGNLATGAYPQATAIVLKWRKDGKFWVGAEMGFRVQSTNTKISLQFSLTFEGLALRSVPSALPGTLNQPKHFDVTEGLANQ